MRVPSTCEPGAGEGREAVDVVAHLFRSCVKSMLGFRLVDLLRVGDALGGLRHAGDCVLRQHLHHQPRAERGELVMERRAVVSGVMAILPTLHIGPGVEPFLHAHDGDARLRVARHDGALDGCRAPPARQERGVDVEAAEPRRIEHRLRQEQAIGDHDGRIGLECSEALLLLRRS